MLFILYLTTVNIQNKPHFLTLICFETKKQHQTQTKKINILKNLFKMQIIFIKVIYLKGLSIIGFQKEENKTHEASKNNAKRYI